MDYFFLPPEAEDGKLMSYTALAFSELTFEIGKSLLATCSSLFAETRQLLCLEWIEADKQR